MQNNNKSTGIKLEILGVITLLLYLCTQCRTFILVPVSAASLELSLYNGLKWIYWEIIEDYPADDCVKPEICKKLFYYERMSPMKGFPKELYYAGIAKYIGFWIYLVVDFLILLFNEEIAAKVGLVYLIAIHVLEEVWTSAAMRKSFRARYKMLNRYNFRYLFYSEDAPYPKRIGKCEIIREYRIIRKKFVTIRMLDTGEYIDRVLISGKKRPGENPVYILYEICKVKYIV